MGFPNPDAARGHNAPRPCKAEGEYFCDPDGVLKHAQRQLVQADLRVVREFTLVSCPIVGLRARAHGAIGAPRPDDELHYFLGVAVLKNLPSQDLDNEGLQRFGESVMDSWGLRGPDCDNSALLIVVAEANRVWLYSQTCRFLCAQEESGQRVLHALESAGNDWTTGLQAAIRMVVTVLKEHSVDDVHRAPDLKVSGRVEDYLKRKEAEWATADKSMQIIVVVVAAIFILGLLVWNLPWLIIIPQMVFSFLFSVVSTVFAYVYYPCYYALDRCLPVVNPWSQKIHRALFGFGGEQVPKVPVG
jgi:hypothetical protein